MALSFKGPLGVSRGNFNPAIKALVPVRLKHTYRMLYLDAMNTWGKDDEHSRRLVLSKLKRWDAKYGFDFPIVDHKTRSLPDVRSELETTSDYSYNRVDPKYFESRATVEGRRVKSIDNPYEPPPPPPEPKPYVPKPRPTTCVTCGKNHVGHGFNATELHEFVSAVGEFGCTI
tara:strand:- start:107 stop:625 length:519 start_codon:yes stop_codon:yes gene_type:complete